MTFNSQSSSYLLQNALQKPFPKPAPRVLCILYFLLFFNTLRIGEGEIDLYGYYLFLSLASIYMLLRSVKIPLVTILSLHLFIIYSFALGFTNPAPLSEQFKFLLAISIFVLLAYSYGSERHIKALIYSCRIVSAGGIFLYFSGIGVDSSYNLSRLQSITSEPSAMSLPISVLCAHGYFKKSYRDLLLGLLAGALCFSPTVLISIIFSLSMAISFVSLSKGKIRSFLLPLVFFAGLLIFTLSLEVDFLNYYIYRFQSAYNYLASGGQSGYSPRLENLKPILEILSTDRWLLGFGPRATEDINVFGLDRSYSLIWEVLFNYGVAGVILMLAAFIFKILTLLRRGLWEIALLAVCIFFVINLNSAHGVAYHGILLMLLFSVPAPEVHKRNL